MPRHLNRREFLKTAGQMDLALDFIGKHAAGPFCVFLSWHPPHPPDKEAPVRFAEPYAPALALITITGWP